jgi:glycosyltransferase involved in cell wall biosynthesis
MRILLLSAYDAGSHRQWREGLVDRLPQHDWTVATLPARHFAWRMRGGPLGFLTEHEDILSADYDRILATSMTDLCTLRGLRPNLARIPTAVYFHENQFAYPSRDKRGRIQWGMHHIYTLLSADTLLFNTRFNLESLVVGAEALLRSMPDCRPRPGAIAERIRSRARVIPVPLEERFFDARTSPPQGPLSILWNHRWEYDKAPERFFAALFRLSEEGLPFRLHVLGQRFRSAPEIFERAQKELKQHIDTWGWVEAETYHRILHSADLVVSTALQEFQGLSVMEAVAAGCSSLVPDRLSYPSFLPPSHRYPSTPDDPKLESAALTEALRHFADNPDELRSAERVDLEAYCWNRLERDYEEIIDRMAIKG